LEYHLSFAKDLPWYSHMFFLIFGHFWVPNSPPVPLDDHLALPHAVLGANGDPVRGVEEWPVVLGMLRQGVHLEGSRVAGQDEEVVLAAQGAGQHQTAHRHTWARCHCRRPKEVSC